MSAFDNVIGYETIKNELIQIVDMVHNTDVYRELGAKLPQGLLLYGAPGLGKTLMAKSFIEESGLRSYTVRRNKGNDDFVEVITSVFCEAKENAPSIVLLDDLDKFANEDDRHRDAQEYVAVQAGIDEVRNSNVFVLATANDVNKLPESLIRSGRFDRKIEVRRPTASDSALIIKHYLSTKRVSEDVNMEDIANLISYSTCAELETILNEAAISAAYARKSSIGMDEIVGSILRSQYDSPDDYVITSDEEAERVALHEAGHLVVCEVLCRGSIGLASIRKRGRASRGGFVHMCKDLKRRPYYALVALAGKAAVELYYCDAVASGCHSDIERAYNLIREGIAEHGTLGIGMIDVSTHRFPETSESLNARNEAVTHAEMERMMLLAKNILLKNRDFLEAVLRALIEKETLLSSDIQKLRNSVTITSVTV